MRSLRMNWTDLDTSSCAAGKYTSQCPNMTLLPTPEKQSRLHSWHGWLGLAATGTADPSETFRFTQIKAKFSRLALRPSLQPSPAEAVASLAPHLRGPCQ